VKVRIGQTEVIVRRRRPARRPQPPRAASGVTREKIVRLIAESNGDELSLRGIAARVGVSHVAVVGHLRRIERDGIVRRDAKGHLQLVTQP